ncbi:Hypothetical protein POVN_LOCUS17 [uncultured virus]|nr:Hypothetical protein POVN_LOCUS17 [uncultured virus]
MTNVFTKGEEVKQRWDRIPSLLDTLTVDGIGSTIHRGSKYGLINVAEFIAGLVAPSYDDSIMDELGWILAAVSTLSERKEGVDYFIKGLINKSGFGLSAEERKLIETRAREAPLILAALDGHQTLAIGSISMQMDYTNPSWFLAGKGYKSEDFKEITYDKLKLLIDTAQRLTALNESDPTTEAFVLGLLEQSKEQTDPLAILKDLTTRLDTLRETKSQADAQALLAWLEAGGLDIAKDLITDSLRKV